jgi:hypothetical protein
MVKLVVAPHDVESGVRPKRAVPRCVTVMSKMGYLDQASVLRDRVSTMWAVVPIPPTSRFSCRYEAAAKSVVRVLNPRSSSLEHR